MARYTLADAYDPPEIELGNGHVFVVREQTKHVEAQLQPLQGELERQLAAVKKGDDLVAVMGRYFDVVLKRIESEDGAGKQAKPSTLLKKAWDSNELSVERLMFVFRVVQGYGDEGPPT